MKQVDDKQHSQQRLTVAATPQSPTPDGQPHGTPRTVGEDGGQRQSEDCLYRLPKLPESASHLGGTVLVEASIRVGGTSGRARSALPPL